MREKLNDVNSLVEEALSKPDAFAKLYDHYFSRIYNYIRFRVNEREAADDLTSQVFEKVFNGLHAFRPDRGQFDGWIFRIAHNVIVDYIRSRKQITYLEDVSFMSANDPDINDSVIANEMKEMIMQALSKLDEREQNIIILKFWGGVNNRQIARITGLTDSNVGVIIYRSLKKLKVILQGQGMISNE